MEWRIGDKRIELVQGDITEQETDAIVNAANSQLIMGGGVAGAILRKGGRAIQEDCDRKSPIGVGQAVLTTGGNLKAKYVIHAVGPRMGEGQEDRKLRDATVNTLKTADAHHLADISFCAISTGIFGYPMDRCAEIMLRNTADYLRGKTGLRKVVFCLYDRNALNTFAMTMERLRHESDGSA
jgi:O-acetyl-ADP-ribose deacetylase (regulator of RNase III)